MFHLTFPERHFFVRAILFYLFNILAYDIIYIRSIFKKLIYVS